MPKKPKPFGDKIIKTFDGSNPPDDFHLPPFGIADIDRAIFKLFDEKLSFEVKHKGTTQKVPVIFATGERFALTRRKNPIRDKDNALILPIISIMRKDIDFAPGQGGYKTAISFREQTSYIIKHRLSDRDRGYQNIINKPGLVNQDNVSSKDNIVDTSGTYQIASAGKSSTRRPVIGFSADAVLSLKDNIGKNIYEIIEIPYPEFVTISYDVVFWTQYMKQSNQMLERLLVNFSGQGEEIAITTEKGYELVAFFKGSFTNNSNFDDFTDSERIIKHGFQVVIPGYIINPEHPGIPRLTRSYTSAPNIEFGYQSTDVPVKKDYQPERKHETVERHVLTDIKNINEGELRRGQSSEVLERPVINPFTKKEEEKALVGKVLHRDERAGETVGLIGILQEIEKAAE